MFSSPSLGPLPNIPSFEEFVKLMNNRPSMASSSQPTQSNEIGLVQDIVVESRGESVEQIQKRVSLLMAKLLEQPSGPEGFTPAHIAAAGNPAALTYLVSQGVWLSRKNKSGISVEGLLQRNSYFPEILAIPRTPNYSVKEPLEIFMEDHVPQKNYKGNYTNHTDDFGLVIEELLIASRNGRDNIRTKQCMEKVCEILGISLKVSEVGSFPRDYWFRTLDGIVRNALKGSGIEKMSYQAESKSKTLDLDGYALYPHPRLDVGKGIVGITDPDLDNPDGKKYFSQYKKKIPYYGEGGNQFVVTNKAGKPCLVIARYQRDLSLLFLRKDAEFKARAAKMEISEPSENKLERACHEMFSQGLVKIEKADGFLDEIAHHELFKQICKDRLTTWPDTKNFVNTSQYIKKLKPFNAAQALKQSGREIPLNYLKQKKLVIQTIAQHYNISEKRIVKLPSVLYHLDMFMFPGPDGKFFLVDFALTTKMLKFFKTHAKSFELSQKDVKLIDEYISSSEALEKRMAPLMTKIIKRLKAAQFGIIPTPGVLIQESKDDYNITKPLTPNAVITLFNGITGFSEKTHRHYYLCERPNMGDHLGDLMMDAFTIFLKRKIPDIDVFFVADHRSENDPLSVMSGESGLHCLTFPIKTKIREKV